MESVSLSPRQYKQPLKVFLSAFVCLFLLTVTAQATNLPVHCGGKYGITKISSALKMINPAGPNTIAVSGSCNENLLIKGFNRLTLLSTTGAAINDVSEGTAAVLDIEDSTDIMVQGFTIRGGSYGVLCFDASLCRFSGNTIEGSTNTGVYVNNSQATFSGDVIQDTVEWQPALAVEASKVSGSSVTVQRSAGGGIKASNGSVLEISSMNIQNNAGDAIDVVDHSHVYLGDSTVSNNGGSGIDVETVSEVLLVGNAVSTNHDFGIYIGDLALAVFFGGSFTGSTTDIYCGGQYNVTYNIQGTTYGSTNCPVPEIQAGAVKRTPLLPRLSRPPLK